MKTLWLTLSPRKTIYTCSRIQSAKQCNNTRLCLLVVVVFFFFFLTSCWEREKKNIHRSPTVVQISRFSLLLLLLDPPLHKSLYIKTVWTRCGISYNTLSRHAWYNNDARFIRNNNYIKGMRWNSASLQLLLQLLICNTIVLGGATTRALSYHVDDETVNESSLELRKHGHHHLLLCKYYYNNRFLHIRYYTTRTSYVRTFVKGQSEKNKREPGQHKIWSLL